MPRDESTGSRPRRRSASHARALLPRRRVENAGQGQAPRHTPLDFDEQANSEQRVPAQVEEVVRHADRLNVKDMLPDFCKAFFEDVPRSHIAGLALRSCPVEGRKPETINLAAR